MEQSVGINIIDGNFQTKFCFFFLNPSIPEFQPKFQNFTVKLFLARFAPNFQVKVTWMSSFRNASERFLKVGLAGFIPVSIWVRSGKNKTKFLI